MAFSTSTSFIDIDAGADRVWAAVTQPELVARWQYGSRLLTDWRVGGPIRFVSEWEGQRFEQWGTVLSYEVPRELSYSLFAPRPDLADVPENYFTMTYTVSPVANSSGAPRTRLTIVQVDPRPAAPGDEGADEQFDGEFDEQFDGDDEVQGEFADDGAVETESPVLIALKELCEE
ncbi:SRPBCC family protein [Subtercola endophyticus]|uniref:SRPBCC family protein n=1 Tax=Subtercola endophyticus TaxID=2895559 RepID=UPI001E299FB2|nr:SRPBCC family protein [Subtercola endophyticus]UFS57451.1 SRPBCC domain-containing protein [Subtercola endophyticus]